MIFNLNNYFTNIKLTDVESYELLRQKMKKKFFQKFICLKKVPYCKFMRKRNEKPSYSRFWPIQSEFSSLTFKEQ